MSNEDKCVCCGRYVPEGRMICNICDDEINNIEEQNNECELLLRMCHSSDEVLN